MKKVLIIGTTNIYGGVGHIMFELCNNMNREKVSFDFLYYQDATDKEKEMIHALGGEFYKVPRYSKEPITFCKAIKKFYKEHHYDVVHIHASSAMLMMYAFPVWKDKKMHIVYQSHVDKIDGKGNQILHKFFQKYVNRYAECKIAVSGIAAEFMYGQDEVKTTVLLKNGIEARKFMFDENVRRRKRQDLDITSKYVIGHIGRFSKQKNHSFLIDVFSAVYEKNKDAMLLMIGNGEDEVKIREKVKDLKLDKNVIFYGTSDNVTELLCVMDCFVFPSLWEGLGIVAIEAQANGLPVIASDRVPPEANITDLFCYKNLNASTEEWVECILQFVGRENDRKLYYNMISDNGYDIEDVVKKLEKIYLDF